MNHCYESIQGWTQFADFYIEVVANASSGAKFVEIGCWKGRSASLMGVEIINSGKDITLYCVDEWADGGPDLTYLRESNLMEQFLKNTAPVSSVIVPVQARSTDAASQFPDQYFDFVFIDAAHDYDYVRADILAWMPKVKPGGVFAGDDYALPGVRKACDEIFGKNVGYGPSWRV